MFVRIYYVTVSYKSFHAALNFIFIITDYKKAHILSIKIHSNQEFS